MSRGTLDPALLPSISLTGLSPSSAGLSRTVLLGAKDHLCSPNPGVCLLRFGLFPFRSPLLWKSMFSFFSSGYLDVSVHRVAVRITMCSLYDDTTLLVPGSPIRKSPDQSYLQLPEAYRCSSRPSSASSAKASAMRPY